MREQKKNSSSHSTSSMRLQAYLSKSGIASRRSVVEELDAGKVKVNGEVVRIPSYPIYPGRDEVTFEDQPVKLSSTSRVYFIFNKPKDVITTTEDTHGRKTVLDYFKHVKERLYPVGRLDQDTTGLLVLTNDGDLAQRLMHPRYGLTKVYEASIDKDITQEEVDKLQSGVEIEGGFVTSPCKMKLLESRLVEVSLHEGHKRQIRLMFKALGFEVLKLHRKFYGPLDLQGLPSGQFRVLTEQEIALLKKAVSGGTPPPRRQSFNRNRRSNRPPRRPDANRKEGV